MSVSSSASQQILWVKKVEYHASHASAEDCKNLEKLAENFNLLEPPIDSGVDLVNHKIMNDEPHLLQSCSEIALLAKSVLNNLKNQR